MDEKISRRVGIIGAGVAGLSTASHLARLGWKNVKLIEARDRIGGRVYSKSYGAKSIEVGAQWIHGEGENIVHEIASKNNLLDKSAKSFVDILKTEAQSFLKSKRSRELYQKLRNVFEEYEFGNANLASVGQNFSEYIKNEIAHLKDKEEIDIAKKVYDWVYRFECHIAGCDDLYQVSSKENYKYCPGNPTVEFKENYASLLNILKETIPPEWVKLNSPVTLIDWTGGECIKVYTGSGESIEVDHVVVTLPLGVLKKQARNLFKPSLPDSKMSSISKMGYGTVNKIFLRFETLFWNCDTPIYNVFWDDGKNHRGFSNEDAFVDTNEKFWTTFKTTGKIPWERCLIYFTYVRHQKNLLCAWITGEAAEFMESLSDDEVLSGCHSVLSHSLPNQRVPKPIAVFRSKWFSDPFSYGSYSYDSVLCDDPLKVRNELTSPINSIDGNGKNFPALLFAGEATHGHFYSTVHGAYETGMREASRLDKFAKTINIGRCNL